MLKINLIPKQYYEKLAVKKMMALFGGLFALVVLAIVGAFAYLLISTSRAEDEIARLEPIAQQTEQFRQEAQQERAKIKPTQDKIEYIQKIMEYNTAHVPIMEEIARYTYKNISYSSVAINGPAVTIQGAAPSIVDLGRYLLGLYRAQHLFSSISISGPPGYPPGGDSGQQAVSQADRPGVTFTVNATLREPVSPPAAPGGTPAGGDPNAAMGMGGDAGAIPPVDAGPPAGGDDAGME